MENRKAPGRPSTPTEDTDRVRHAKITRHYTLRHFLLRYVKDRVYATPVPDIDEIKQRIIQVIGGIPAEMLQNPMWN
ncbi:hypothetical protein NPIL_448321 [Nephila pilipes]|uniref:Uncharacterized protein n=1 Tax=Nephila pilipes TaxID=299642 RepID=A0A8X6ILD3_NEPPI|nr:hypothetical protein NPIL_448321 [Nephila pilipes]